MKYDPILCMNVPDGVKTKDAVPNGWKVTLEKNRNKYFVYSKAMTARGAELEARKEYPDATVLNVERHNVADSNTIDKAIKLCDYAYGTAEIKDVNGKWVVFHGGKYIQEFDNSDDAEAFVREKGWH